jgi:CRISPR/Cas system-associated exonuclease Cas4 (RecB family)
MLETGEEERTVGVTSIAKVMGGECPYREWMNLRKERAAEETPSLKRWKEEHDKLLDYFVKQIEEKGWVAVTEYDVECDGIRGKMDILARRENDFRVVEVKSGKQYPYHLKQLEMYMAMERQRNPDATVSGELRYIDAMQTLDSVDDGLWENALHIRNALKGDETPQTIEGRYCSWCDYAEECPRR